MSYYIIVIMWLGASMDKEEWYHDPQQVTKLFRINWSPQGWSEQSSKEDNISHIYTGKWMCLHHDVIISDVTRR